MNVVHVGLGKTGTTFLQKSVYPQLQEHGIVKHFNPGELMQLLADFNHYKVHAEQVRLEMTKWQDTLVSLETLVEWDPLLWESACRRNYEAFGPETTVIISIRDPASYLRSLYQQKVKAGNVVSPYQFFMSEEQYGFVRRMMRVGELDAINVDRFRLKSLVEAYASRFNRVVVVSSESISKLMFLDAISSDAGRIRSEVESEVVKSPRENAAYSDLAMQLTMKREVFLNAIGIKTLGSNDQCLARHLGTESSANDYNQPWVSLPWGSRLRQLPIRVIRYGFGSTGWHLLMTRVIDRLPGRRKYVLPDKVSFGRYHSENEEFHRAVVLADGGFLVFSKHDMKDRTEISQTA